MTAIDQIERSAVLSECGTYRYRLARTNLLGALPSSGTVCWIMCNPSIADANVDDPTIRRCVGYTRRWGYGALAVVNLYARRATYPQDLRDAVEAGWDAIGPDNDAHISDAVSHSALVIAGWGATGADVLRFRPAAVAQLVHRAGKQIHVLGVTQANHPRHPLYLKGEATPQVWN